jgi:hypothetical protein
VKRSLSLILMCCFLSSCATIRHGTNEVLSVDSNPSGANATIKCANNISASGTTPARLTIPRKADGCRVDIEKSGMKAQTVQLERGFNNAYWLNFIPAGGFPLSAIAAFSDGGSDSLAVAALGAGVFGVTGLIVDRVTGAMYDHDPNVIKVTLQPEH